MNWPEWTSPDGRIRLINADCLEVLPHIEADCAVTDTPYGIEGGSGGDARDYGKGHYDASWQDTPAYIEAVCVPAIRHLASRLAAVAVTPGIRCLHLYPTARDIGCFWTPAAATHGPWGFTTFQPILYYGKDWRAGRGAWPSGRSVTEAAVKNGHPCPKPIGAWQWLVEKVSRPDAIVLDPFAGSCTTAIACIRTDRRCICIEKEPKYFQIGIDRCKAEYARTALFDQQECVA